MIEFERNNVKAFTSNIEEEAVRQINELSRIYDKEQIRIMPDVHAGKGCTIGTTIALNDKVTPNTVGVDIGCGMLCICLGNIKINLEKLDDVINKCVPCGFNIHEVSRCDAFTKDYINARFRCKDSINIERAIFSVGTLGGGNHFIEIDIDDENNKYLIIHSGSRHLGVEVCTYYQNIAVSRQKNNDEEIRKTISLLKSAKRFSEIQGAIKNIAKKDFNKDLAYIQGKDMQDYLSDMRAAQVYAKSNRSTIGIIILSEIGIREYPYSFETVHNYIDERNILRKGAISANKGEKVLIPLNMRDGCLICRGKGNPDWNFSAPHGAGRIMSRAKAKKTINIDDFKEAMSGVYSTSVCKSTIDESPFAYKSSEEIKELIKDTVTIEKVIKPIYNFKSKE